jgi:hypothetical protein
MSPRLTLLTILLLAGALSAPATGPLPAQEPSAGETAQREEQSLDREIASLRRRMEALQRHAADAELRRSLRSADSVLRNLSPNLGRSLGELGALQARLALDAARGAPSDNEELGRLAHELAMLQGRLAHDLTQGMMGESLARVPARRAVQRTVPRGWLGVSVVGTIKETVRGGDVVTLHRTYPVIQSVEPGSPAQEAGLRSGDTILAYNGRDVCKEQISMAKLLEPGRRVVVRVRRDGRTRNVPLRITERPARYADRALGGDPLEIGPDVHVEVGPPATMFWSPGDTAALGAAELAAPPRPRVRVRVPVPPAPPLPPLPPSPPMSLLFGSATTGVAGAEVARMNDDLRDAFGGRQGVLVIAVAAETPAARAGLRGGDVIVAADGQAVTTPAALLRLMRRAEQRAERQSVVLDVVRKKAVRKVTLVWTRP